MRLFEWFFKVKEFKDLEKKYNALLIELQNCNDKILEKQEYINQTNSYWKKKMHELKAKVNRKKDL